MPILATALLSFFGKNWKACLLGAVGLGVAAYVLVLRAELSSARKSAAAYKADNAILAAANKSEHATVQKLLALNAANQRICAAAASAAQQNITIAKREASAAKARAANYGSILHGIETAPADPSPVSADVRLAVDSLWPQ